MRSQYIIPIGIVAVFIISFLLSDKPIVAESPVIHLKGIIIDNRCIEETKSKNTDLEQMAFNHTKSCAINPSRSALGFSIYASRKLWGIDDDSFLTIRDYLKRSGSGMFVEVRMILIGSEYTLLFLKDAERK